MRISDWSSDVCSSDLTGHVRRHSVSPARCCDHDVDRHVGDDLGIGTLTANIELVEIAGLSHRDKVAVGAGANDTDHQDRKSDVKGNEVVVRGDIGGRRYV